VFALGDVVAVVRADAEDLRWPRGWGAEVGWGELGAGGIAVLCAPAAEFVPPCINGLWVGPEKAVTGLLDIDGSAFGEEGESIGEIAYTHACSFSVNWWRGCD